MITFEVPAMKAGEVLNLHHVHQSESPLVFNTLMIEGLPELDPGSYTMTPWGIQIQVGKYVLSTRLTRLPIRGLGASRGFCAMLGHIIMPHDQVSLDLEAERDAPSARITLQQSRLFHTKS